MNASRLFILTVLTTNAFSPVFTQPVGANSALQLPPTDICIQTLGASNPGAAAGLSARKDQAQKQSMEEFKIGRGWGPNNKDTADHKETAEKAAEGAEIGGEYTAASAPVFAAGAATELDPVKKTILTLCAQKRGAQGAAQEKNSEQNRQIAEIAVRDITSQDANSETPAQQKPQIMHINPSVLGQLVF